MGTLLGYADNAGLSAGDHDHFGLKPVAPNVIPNKEPQWINVLDNGFQSAINPDPYWNGLFAEDQFHFQFDHDLEIGDENEEVRQLQRALTKEGVFHQSPTGFFRQGYQNSRAGLPASLCHSRTRHPRIRPLWPQDPR